VSRDAGFVNQDKGSARGLGTPNIDIWSAIVGRSVMVHADKVIPCAQASAIDGAKLRLIGQTASEVWC